MVAGEAGADYVMLGTLNGAPEADDELFELVSWWNEMFVIPCAAAGRLTPELAVALVRAGADLVAVPGSATDVAALAAALQHVAGPDDVETQG